MEIQKNPDKMTLFEANEVIDFVTGDEYNDVKLARKFVWNLLDRGEVKAQKGSDAERALEGRKKKPKKSEGIDLSKWNTEHEYVGKKVFTNLARGKIVAVSKDGKRYIVDDVNGNRRDISAGSCSFKAVNSKYRETYSVDRDNRTGSGKPSIGVDDPITEALKCKGEREYAKICKDNGIDPDRWWRLNTGMQRMNLGNVLRARYNRGEAVFIDGNNITESAKNKKTEDHRDGTGQPGPSGADPNGYQQG